jgi:hypothetical protein
MRKNVVNKKWLIFHEIVKNEKIFHLQTGLKAGGKPQNT